MTKLVAKMDDFEERRRQKAQEIVSQVVTITPEVAREWLYKTMGNRPLKSQHLRRLSAEVVDDEWVLNGETIKFDIDGKLIDGHHRLEMVLRSGMAIRSLVVWNLPREAWLTVDTGSRRSGGDVLAISGEKGSNALAAALNWVWRYEHGEMGMRTGQRPSFQKIYKTLDQYPTLRNSISYGNDIRRVRLGYPSAFTFIHFILSLKDQAAANEFFAKLASGTSLEAGSPILVLRNRLQENATAKTAKLYQEQIVAITFRAWNYWRRGELVRDARSIQWTPGQSFPEPI